VANTSIPSGAPCPQSTLAAANVAGFARFLALNILYRKEGR
jgi:hypothetical protein